MSQVDTKEVTGQKQWPIVTKLKNISYFVHLSVNKLLTVRALIFLSSVLTWFEAYFQNEIKYEGSDLHILNDIGLN